jgi:hypothetical protein
MSSAPPVKRRRMDVNNEEPRNEYNGFLVPNEEYQVPDISIGSSSEIDPLRFYKEYISQRRPVVIQNLFRNNDVADCGPVHVNSMFKLASELVKLQNLEHLRNQAGDENIKVEKRTSTSDSYGKGTEVEMTFSQFLNEMEHNNENSTSEMYYLTTQDVDCSSDGRPHLMSPFVRRIFQTVEKEASATKDVVNEDIKDMTLPLQPELMGNLIPQNINIWMGKSNSGSSSGLHHDYHDNLYIVLKGRKRFRLFSPKDIDKMYTRGRVHGPFHVHPNGRINYFHEPTTAYGADLQSDQAAEAERKKEEAERLLKAAEEDLEAGVDGAKERLELAETMLEEAMDALIDIEMDGEDDGKEANWIFGTVDDVYEEDDDEEYEDDDDNDADSNDDFKTAPGDDKDEPLRFVDKTVKNPDNFSEIDPSILDDKAELKKKYPKFIDAKSAFCTIEEGDMLYLPASWFHEVISMGKSGDQKEDYDKNDKDVGIHMAINYWFHPPDAEDNFEKPYSTDFWPNDFKLRSV